MRRRKGRRTTGVRAEADCSLAWEDLHSIGWGLSFSVVAQAVSHMQWQRDKQIKEETANVKMTGKKIGIYYLCPTARWKQTNLCSLTSQLPRSFHVATPVQPSQWLVLELLSLFCEVQGIAGAALIVTVLEMHSQCCCFHIIMSWNTACTWAYQWFNEGMFTFC